MPIYTLDEMSVEEFERLFAGGGKPEPPTARQGEDGRWLIEHLGELAQDYPDQWVTVYDQKVVGAARGLDEAEDRAYAKVGRDKKLATVFVEGKVHVF